MSVGQAIMETQQEKENEMENKRYHFSGFAFGEKNYYNLSVRLNNFAGYGTSYTSEWSLELTEEERLELIKLLINAETQEKN